MRILVHDFGGYAFPLQLSQSLSQRKHEICHAYCASLTTTPPGIAQGDFPFEIRALRTARPFDKYNLIKRWHQEHEYGHLIRDVCCSFAPDLVLSANAPLPTQQQLLRLCKKRRYSFVFWLQDLLGLAAYRILQSKQWVLGATVGRYFQMLERALLKGSDAIVSITHDFVPLLERMGVPSSHIHVIENWGVLPEASDIPTDWAASHGLQGRPLFLYTGTLSLKHNPELLLDLARATQKEAFVVVLSQGIGANWLRSQKAAHNLSNLIILPYQRAEDLPAIYASADVLVALLTRDAGTFSVPSKVLTYLCTAKPILAAMPPDNLAARIIQSEGAGFVTRPGDSQAFVTRARHLLEDEELRLTMSAAAQAYSTRQFNIEVITDRFEAVFERVLP